MISKINWPHVHQKENPFGGTNGFRNLRITFHSGSFSSASPDETRALEILYGLASLEDIDAVSFDGEIYPKVVFGPFSNEGNYIDVQIIDQDNNVLLYGGTPKSSIDDDALLHLMGIYSSSEVQKNEMTR